MNKHTQRSLYNPAAFDFPAIFEGRGVMVTINWNKDLYDIFINGMMVARVKFDEESYQWRLAQGDLDDPDLVKEIGERIEMRYNYRHAI